MLKIFLWFTFFNPNIIVSSFLMKGVDLENDENVLIHDSINCELISKLPLNIVTFCTFG